MSMKNPIREKLDRGGLLLCMMLRQSDMAAAEIAAQYGIDMLCIDNEHYPFNPQRVEALARAAQIYGSGVVIRVPNEEAARVAQMMDCQLQGIKIPHVETKEQALAIVNAVKYAPVGTRGFCPITRAADYGFTASPADYPVRANRDSVVSIMVETKRGLENLDEILSIPEIDVVAIGPSDVSASYGLPGQTTRWSRRPLRRASGRSSPRASACATSIKTRSRLKRLSGPGCACSRSAPPSSCSAAGSKS